MIKFQPITDKDYSRCSQNMNLEMNVRTIEYLNEAITGSKGLHKHIHADRVVHPNLDCHDEFFKDKQIFLSALVSKWEEKLRPTLSNSDAVEFDKIVKSLNEAKDMIELLWSAEQLLKAIRSVE